MADRRVESVPLPAEDDSRDADVVVQQNVGPAAEDGSGEWPSPDAPSTGPSPGPAAAEGDPVGTPARPAPGDQRAVWPPEGFKDALDDDPIAGGSGSTPQTDEGA